MKKSTLLIAAVAAIVFVVIIGRYYISSDDFNLENPYWNGLTQLSGADPRPISSLSDLDGLGVGDTLLVISPSVDYTGEESAHVAEFLQRGGSVVVMDDFGQGNSLLNAIGSPITFNPVPLCDYQDYHVNVSLPEVTSFNPSAPTADVSELIFNHPVSLNVSGEAYALAMTSNRAWLDYNNNSELDGSETMGKYDVAAMAEYGNGRLIAIGDPDLCINSMLGMGDNQLFISHVLEGNVLVDVSHGRGLSPLGVIYYSVKYDTKVQLALVLLLLVVGYAGIFWHPLATHVKRLIGREPGNR